MSKRFIVATLLIGLTASAAIAKSHVPTKNTRNAIKAYVKDASKVVAKSGPSCDKFKDKDWMAGDYYVFVDGPDNKIVCHPNPSMVGKDNADITDANGKKVGTELIEASKKKGGGWVNYVWPRPGTDKPVPKSTYTMRVKAPDGKWYVVGAGGYELK
ncbi:MAG TPA: cache domain-containing protein [Thermoanaerobaculia bacterium]|nr:cache domain-containing protein [Thermoanaerobaculia bacterium]